MTDLGGRERDLQRLKDRAQAAQRLLDDPLAMELFEGIKQDALAALLSADTDEDMRRQRDTYKTVLALEIRLRAEVRNAQEAGKPRLGIA
jgi:hypothetical protein